MLTLLCLVTSPGRDLEAGPKIMTTMRHFQKETETMIRIIGAGSAIDHNMQSHLGPQGKIGVPDLDHSTITAMVASANLPLSVHQVQSFS